MAKSKEIGQALNDLMGTVPAPASPAEKTRYDNKNSKIVAFRIAKDDKEKLYKHFKLKGYINPSTAIRELVYKYMVKEGLIK